jgi:GT2 family glycosyltransferase
MSKVYIVLLNYNGWQDTLECIESILHSDYFNYQIIVVDNASSDNSFFMIQSWLQERKQSQETNDAQLDFVIYDEPAYIKEEIAEKELNLNYPITLIQSGENKGFSAGNNVGIQYAIAKSDADFLWLLNNDTIIKSSALHELVNKAAEYKIQERRVGVIGAKLMEYSSPELIQTVGGVFNKWLATTKMIGACELDIGQYDNGVDAHIDFPSGASMFVQVKFIQDIGLMSEDYFLYFEEIDWVTRGRITGWDIGYCGTAQVFHKGGASAGSSTSSETRSVLSDYYGIKNRVIFTRKFHSEKISIVYLGILVAIINRIKKQQFGRVWVLIKAMLLKPL